MKLNDIVADENTVTDFGIAYFLLVVGVDGRGVCIWRKTAAIWERDKNYIGSFVRL